jgi:glycosyltransferase involved in cell wall biosynthesis
MSRKKTLVSVVIPTYNRKDETCEAIESVLAQDCSDVEIIVVDDGSTDETGKVILDRFARRIRFVYQHNQEKSAARNRGIKEATGKFLCMLDSDDLMLPGAIGAMLACFRNNKDADAVYGLSVRQRQDGTLLKQDKNRIYPEGDILTAFLDERLINNNSYMIKRELMLNFGMYREDLTNHEDYELLLRLTSKLKFYFCEAEVCMVRRSRESAKDNTSKIIEQGVRAMDQLFSTEGLPPLLLVAKDRLYAQEYMMVATACYHSGRRKEFRANFKKARALCPSLGRNGKYLRRYVLSFVK